MITNFKIYETKSLWTSDNLPKVGDYVLMSGRYLKSQKEQHIKIIRELHFPGSGSYEHMYNNGEKGVSEHTNIIRYLTPEEIEKFETEIEVTKYNL